MFAWFRPAVPEVVGYSRGLVTFRYRRRLLPQQAFQSRARLPGGLSITLKVVVLQQLSRNLYLGRANERLALEKAFLPSLVTTEPYKVHPSAATTHVRTLTLRSPQLPHFQGLTREISTQEALVLLSGPVAEQLTLAGFLDLEPPLPLLATVEWCAPRDARTWLVRLTLHLSAEDHQRLRCFLREC